MGAALHHILTFCAHVRILPSTRKSLLFPQAEREFRETGEEEKGWSKRDADELMKTLLKMMEVHGTYKQTVWEDKEMMVEHQPIHEVKSNTA